MYKFLFEHLFLIIGQAFKTQKCDEEKQEQGSAPGCVESAGAGGLGSASLPHLASLVGGAWRRPGRQGSPASALELKAAAAPLGSLGAAKSEVGAWGWPGHSDLISAPRLGDPLPTTPASQTWARQRGPAKGCLEWSRAPAGPSGSARLGTEHSPHLPAQGGPSSAPRPGHRPTREP